VGLIITKDSSDEIIPYEEIDDEVIGTGEAAATEETAEVLDSGEAASTDVEAEVLAAGDGSEVVFHGILANDDIEAGTVAVTATVGAAPVTMSDDGEGRLSGTAGAGTIDYTTGLFSLVFGTAPDNATDVTANYSHTPPAVTFSGTLSETPIVPGTVEVTDGVETFTDEGDGTLTGDAGGSGTVNYTTGDISVTFHVAPLNAVDITVDYSHTPPTATFSDTLLNTPVEPGTVVATDGVETFSDNGRGVLTGDAGGSGTINYDTGAISVTFAVAPLEDVDVEASYVTAIDGVLDEPVDTARNASGIYISHGSVRQDVLKVGATNSADPDATLLGRLNAKGIYPA
jgi:hypothetical protein